MISSDLLNEDAGAALAPSESFMSSTSNDDSKQEQQQEELQMSSPMSNLLAQSSPAPVMIYARETFIFSARWMSFIRETEGQEAVDSVLAGCKVMPWSWTKPSAGGGFSFNTEDQAVTNMIKIVLDSQLKDQAMSEKIQQLFELFQRAEQRQMAATQNRPIKFHLTEHVLFKRDVSGFVIGKGGNNLWNIKQYTGVDLLVVDDGRKNQEPKPDGFDRLIINGASSFYVHNARAQVQRLFEQAANFMSNCNPQYIPLYAITPPSVTTDPYSANAAFYGATAGYHIMHQLHGPPPPSGFYGGGISSFHGGASLPPPNIYGTPTQFTATGGGAHKRPRMDVAGISPVTNNNDGSVAEECNTLPLTIEALMEQLGSHFEGAKKLISESLPALMENSLRDRLKTSFDELAIKNHRIDQLIKGTETARQKFSCIGCNAEEREVVFTACRHLLFCVFCAGKYSTCPQCGADVSEPSKLTIDRCVGYGNGQIDTSTFDEDDESPTESRLVVKEEFLDE